MYFMIVISRSRERNYGRGRGLKKVYGNCRGQFELRIFTYDDLLNRAKKAYAQLSSLNFSRKL